MSQPKQKQPGEILAELQDQIGLTALLEALVDNQKEAWDNCAGKYGETENITRFYEKVYINTEKLLDKVEALKLKYPTISEV